MMNRSLRAEIAKFRRRRGIVVLLSLAVLLVVVTYLARGQRQVLDLKDEAQRISKARSLLRQGVIDDAEFRIYEARERELRRFLSADARILAFPSSIQFGFQTLDTGGGLFVGLAAALMVGSEFGWGTYRNLLAFGRGRWNVLLTQFTAFLVLVAIMVAGVALAGAVLGLADSLLFHNAPVRFHWNWEGLAVSAGATVLVLGLWSALGMLSGVLSRSAGVAVTVTSLVWVGLLLGSLLSSSVRDWGIDGNAAPLLLTRASHQIHGMIAFAGLDTSALPGAGRGVVFLVGMTFAAWTGSIIRFLRTDIL